MSEYPMGARVVFADANATVSHGMAGTVTGVINGDAITDDDGDVVFVPVFAQRDNGREATTIFVAVANVLEVKP